ncbi:MULTISPECIES: inositol monophosphatase family protein [unclassified Synechococcus]|uniref:inositol monophosphatase family protein n=1 Tax=unclassified Synechococcus TaxID=2626047 RepID=UPI0008FF3107|nr:MULTISPECIES: inositol monophosphatase family protein [unclassified Synechococcus]APD48918.1 inositol monophosphatase [Synechococcus sp. SynAce01]MCT0202328.1 inositol monophosphatase [Synechococcus sp. CS-603]MCT0246409.1 inositol monophosphatase [Synechococcus sp. CS-601]TWB93328.1 myo-inositol-1(or 4)-monophosphatase [Synechococcus sp. Ace-Pa]
MSSRPLEAGSGHQALSDQALAASGLAPTEIERLSGVARSAAAAGAAVLQQFYGHLEQIREKGRAGDLVTEADLAAEAAVLEVLSAQTPELGVLAEESGRHPSEAALEWCVDPLDGTTNYAHSYPFFATSVGLTWRGLPLLGAIEAPALRQCYWAAPGLGAWCNDQRLQVSGCSDLAASLLVTGFAYDRQSQPDTNYAEFCWFTHRTRGVRRGGSAAVDLAFVAAGRLDGYWERGLSSWDIAAGVVLVEQAGGVVSRYDGSPLQLSEGRLIASAPGLHQPLMAGLAQCRPLPGACYGIPGPEAEA